MKKIYKHSNLLAYFLFLLILSPKVKAQSYCSSQPSNSADEEIYNFMLNGSVTNPLYSFSNGCSTPAPGPGSSLGEYSNFTTLGTFATLIQGVVATFSVNEDECDGPTYYANGIAIYIDYNQNGSFADPGEQVFVEPNTTLSPRTVSGSFIVPISALTGTTTLRIICAEGISGSGFSPCLSYGYGETEDYVININAAAPCSASPAANSLVTPTAPVCPNSNVFLTGVNNYTQSGITYTWYASTASNVGPFTAIPSATNLSYTTPGITALTWYQVVATCAFAPISTTYAVGAVSVAATTTNSVPYFEGFENSSSLQNNLPNCSWNRNTSAIKTGTAGNGSPLNGNGFAEYYVGNCSGIAPSNTGYLYSNGIQLIPGITYSASVWYSGYQNTSVSLLYGSAQSPGSLTLLDNDVSPGTSTYTPLSGTFQVATAGIYYVAIRNIDGSGSCSYNSISYDDLSITIPCTSNVNSVNLSLTGPSTICEGQSANLIASGANTYSWSTGANTSSISASPVYIGTYSVIATNTLTGCSVTAVKQVSVNPLPAISIYGTGNSVCLGSSIGVGATGAFSYTWSNGSNTQFVTLTPTTTTTYSVLGIGSYGCIGLATQVVTVNPLPTITVVGSRTICFSGGNFTASGANTYTWSSNSYYLQGSAVTIMSSQANACTVSGTDGNGCVGTTVLNLVVDPCTSLASLNGNEISNAIVYPNPTNGEFTIELKNGMNKIVEIIDVTGRIVLIKATDLDLVHLNISSLSNGVYYAKITSNNTANTLKIVKQ